MTRGSSALVTLAAVAALAAACTSAATPGPTTPPSATLPPGLESVPPSAPPVTGEVPADVLGATRAMLEASVGVEAAAAAEIEVAQAVTWPDGSLGCPEPGMVYTQALVPGYQVIYLVDGVRYDYRVGNGQDIRLCEPGGPRG